MRRASDLLRTDRSSLTKAQIDKAIQHMAGKRNVDLLKLSDAAGISVGAAKILNEARKEHFRTQGGTGPTSRAARIDSFLKQKWIRK